MALTQRVPRNALDSLHSADVPEALSHLRSTRKDAKSKKAPAVAGEGLPPPEADQKRKRAVTP
jgi:hypothetical protein